ncbi:prepilin-type N-terminal cleavage/methylation domain-containing protein [Pseudomonas kunmingensis]|uniref:GspH/FimT family pseudopilin n=1 Tax=Stutzerimonas kunmingensis TaxID=1211807 RepID=UPI0015E34AB1|nr:GspH/FimT family pseudopilin [Stutzerimonas kunmingensis]MBA1237853.1 prepilin-type N-terminal cleavage/methylation domain-containing protein [Stutzerimonas kunmingensis]
MANRNQGFTLIELIITLSILGIVVAIAIPVVDETIARSRREALKDEVERILHNARAQAIIQRRTVEVCGTGDGKNCSASWADGWLVRTSSGQILQLTQLPTHDALRWQGFSDNIRFRDNGTTPTSNGRFYQCYRQQIAWQLIISRQGRVRQALAAENQQKASLCQ